MMRVLVALLAVLALMFGACGSSDWGTPATEPVVSEVPQPDGAVASRPLSAAVDDPATVSVPTVPTSPVQAPEPVDVAVRSITVGGMGSEYAEPVRCVVDLGVTSRRPTVIEASRAAAASAKAMTGTLLAAGVEASHIQTSDFSVGTYYEDYPTVAGYEAYLGYRVTIPEIDQIGEVLASAIEAGGDDVRAWGVRFESDPTGLMEAARARAWADVESRASALAALADEPLGDVLDVHEKVLVSSTHGMTEGGEGDAAAFDIPVSPGVAGVIVLLTVTFAIGT